MSVEIEDKTGMLPSLEDVADAIRAVESAMIKIMELPPQLGVELPNILRCLRVTDVILRLEQERRKP